MDRYFCLELCLQPLSELLIRQVGKSNVQWFSYPFLPPTTFSGFVASLLDQQGSQTWHKNYIEVNDDSPREVGLFFPGVFSVGAYPEPGLVRRNRHYRQHLGDVYNYEEFAWAGNKKLAVAESFWTPELRGFLLASEFDPLKQLAQQLEGILFRVMRLGKKGSVKVRLIDGPYELKPESVQDRIPSTVSPLEMLRRFPTDLEVLYVPMRKRAGNPLEWEVYPCVFGQPICGETYIDKNESKSVIIPKPLVSLVQG